MKRKRRSEKLKRKTLLSSPIEPPQVESLPVKPRHVSRWRKFRWGPLITFIVPTLIASYTLVVVVGNRADTRATEGLNRRPQLSLRTFLGQVPDLPPHFTIENSGPMDAAQVEVQLLSHFYDSARDRTFSGYGTEQRYRFHRMAPFDRHDVLFDDHWLNVNARLHQPLQNNVMEIRIGYRHPTSADFYQERALYFVGPDGRWVGENSSSIAGNETYRRLKEEILERVDNIPATYSNTDKLHPSLVDGRQRS